MPTDSNNADVAADEASTLWRAIAQAKPSLCSHISIHPQYFRGEKWYVLADETTGQHLRLNQSAFALVGRFDGVLTVDSIFTFLQEEAASTDAALITAVHEIPGKEDIIRLLVQLHSLGSLQGLGDKASEKLVAEYNNRYLRERPCSCGYWY